MTLQITAQFQEVFILLYKVLHVCVIVSLSVPILCLFHVTDRETGLTLVKRKHMETWTYIMENEP